MRTLVLLSGGIDSAVVLADRLAKGDECEAICFDYGQPHAIELGRAAQIAFHYSVPLLTRAFHHLPLVNDVVFAGRNLVLAGIAIAEAQAHGFNAIALGCNASDWERFPDCRPAFWKAVNEAADAYSVHVLLPILRMSKTEVVRCARDLGVPLELTWSCYSPRDGEPCGECLACTTRRKALAA